MMAHGSTMAASVIVLGLACFRQASAFVVSVRSPAATAPAPATAAGLTRINSVGKHRLHRRTRAASGVYRLSMQKAAGSQDVGNRRSSSSSSGGGGASTRFEFGAGLGAAAAAIVMGGTSARDALAEDATGDAATAVVATAGAEGAAPAASPAATETKSSLRELGLEVPYTGKLVPLNKFLGSRATLVVNGKLDDPEALHQMPGITKLASEYSKDGLNVLLFPTDQGTFEADEDRVVRIKFYQFYGFGQYPKAVVFDKIDIVGNTIHPFYRYLCRALKNPNGIARITLNYEKFLLDQDGKVVRRYPRKLEAADFEADVKAVIAGDPLPAENRDYKLSWLKADQEATKSEYAFKLGLNYYNN
ncbi:unnamed protein product [Ectocarpus sp. 12 AP-2014]